MRVPTGRMSRMMRLAGLGARTGLKWAFDREGDAIADNAAKVLGNMRGLAAKIGQMASYVDGVVPAGKSAAFERALRALQDSTPTSSPEAIAGVIEGDLGKAPDEVFAQWTPEPFASASIGQVHRARTHDGHDVAVKVQHPHIADAVEDDLSNMSVIGQFKTALLGNKFELQRAMEELKERFRAELDYELEARSQQRFAEIHADDPTVEVPRVFQELCGPRVLTSAFVEGRSLQELVDASLDERRLAAQTLWRFVFKSILAGGVFNADPHPGNFLFHGAGKITALDFGCVVEVPEPRRRIAIQAHTAAAAKDRAGFREAGRLLMETRGGEFEALVLDAMEQAFAPLLQSPFLVTRDYVASLIESVKGGVRKGLTTSKDEFVPLPEGTVFLNRLQFGFYSVLARLNVEVDYAQVERDFLGGC